MTSSSYVAKSSAAEWAIMGSDGEVAIVTDEQFGVGLLLLSDKAATTTTTPTTTTTTTTTPTTGTTTTPTTTTTTTPTTGTTTKPATTTTTTPAKTAAVKEAEKKKEEVWTDCEIKNDVRPACKSTECCGTAKKTGDDGGLELCGDKTKTSHTKDGVVWEFACIEYAKMLAFSGSSLLAIANYMM